MKLLLLHLSDIHLRSQNDPVIGRIESIRRAVQALPEFAACVLVVTGDVAFSGQAEEYAVAHRFFDGLRDVFAEKGPAPIVAEVFIPGNHDCSLPEEDTQLRELMVSRLLGSDDVRQDTSQSSLLRKSLEAQTEFALFVTKRSEQLAAAFEPPGDLLRRLMYTVDVEAAGVAVRFQCFNTASLSQRHEQRGKLLAPVWAFTEGNGSHAQVRVALFHHPYPWLEEENAKAFRKLVTRTSDVAMTGHEHEADQFTVGTIRGERTEYFEGTALQTGSDASGTGFNTLLLDVAGRRCQFTLHTWQGDHYAAQEQSDWRPFQATLPDVAGRFEPADEFSKWLRDAGVGFTHPRKRDLHLQDIFVYPDLEDHTPVEKNQEQTIRGDKIRDYILEHEKVLLLGDERCGRTSLAKMLWRDLAQAGRVPLLMSGSDLKSPKEEAIRRVIERQVERQYGPCMAERFWQLDANERVLLLDDIAQCGLNRTALRSVLDLLSRRFGVLVLFADDLFRLAEVPLQVEDAAAAMLLSFRHCTIKPFGHRLRRDLIERWCLLGQEETASEEEVASQVRDAENLVTALLGKNLLPSYPLFVLSILQIREANVGHNTEMGSYGHHYQALITTALHEALHQIKPSVSVDTVYALASEIAYQFFRRETKSLPEKEMARAIAEYKARMRMRFDDGMMLQLLHRARVLTRNTEGRYAFSYGYGYYFFTARYIHQNLHLAEREAEMRDLIQRLTTHLFVEEYANIVIFLVHFSKDERTIQTILSHARRLYTQYLPCDLDSHVEFVGMLTGRQLPRLQLDATNLKRNNEEYRSRLDEADSQEVASPNGGYEVRLREGEELAETLQINAALKTLQVMGQILRNFPGSLPGDLKEEIATECYLLGLRTLRMFHTLMEQHLDAFRSFFSEVVREARGIHDDGELASATDRVLRTIVLGSAYWMIKTISQAVGSEQLEETFEEIHDSRVPLSVKLIDLSIKLDHFRCFPVGEIDNLKAITTNEVRAVNPLSLTREKQLVPKKEFAFYLLQCLVRDHLYLYPVSQSVRQSVCAKLGIVANDIKMLVPADKHLVAAR
jgi:hypothetical protein